MRRARSRESRSLPRVCWLKWRPKPVLLLHRPSAKGEHPVRDDGTTLAEPGKHVSVKMACTDPPSRLGLLHSHFDCPQKLKQARADLWLSLAGSLKRLEAKHPGLRISIFSVRQFTWKEASTEKSRTRLAWLAGWCYYTRAG